MINSHYYTTGSPFVPCDPESQGLLHELTHQHKVLFQKVLYVLFPRFQMPLKLFHFRFQSVEFRRDVLNTFLTSLFKCLDGGHYERQDGYGDCDDYLRFHTSGFELVGTSFDS